MGRAPCCEKVGLKRGPWTPEEDEKLIAFIKEHGHGSWRALPKKAVFVLLVTFAGLLRCGKSCRLRWTNYLRPDIKRGEFSASEETAILQLHSLLGNRWSAIASHLPQRTDNEIKNYWNTHLKKKLVKMGLDPTTHKPIANSTVLMNNCGSPTDDSGTAPAQLVKLVNSSGSSKSSTVNTGNIIDINISSSCINDQDGAAANLLLRSAIPMKGSSSATMHLTQWESVRLEAEARLTQEAKMRAKGVWQKITPISSNFVAGPPSLSKAGLPVESHICVPGAIKAVSAVELMNALHNWEKSLQGQAGLLWPESWRVATITASHTSCCSHSESSSSSSPPAATPDGAAATSSMSLGSLDSACKLSEAVQMGSSMSVDHHGGGCSHSPHQKLSWSDALMPPKYPSSLLKPTIDVCRGEGPNRGSFSSLMLDAVLGRSLAVQGPISAIVPKLEAHGSRDKLEKEIVEDKTSHEAELVDKRNLDEASNVSEVTGEMQQDDTCTEDEDNDDDDGERSLSADGTSDLFRDLPKLKRDATTTAVSYTALLSEEISDYWSNMVLKEQISSPTIHLTF